MTYKRLYIVYGTYRIGSFGIFQSASFLLLAFLVFLDFVLCGLYPGHSSTTISFTLVCFSSYWTSSVGFCFQIRMDVPIPDNMAFPVGEKRFKLEIFPNPSWEIWHSMAPLSGFMTSIVLSSPWTNPENFSSGYLPATTRSTRGCQVALIGVKCWNCRWGWGKMRSRSQKGPL